MINRKDMIAGQVLREVVQKAIKKVLKENKEAKKQEKVVLREIVRKMLLQEKTPVGDEAPHESTGINVLRKTLKKIIPTIRDDYMSLTTDENQRKSYMSHLINGIDNILAPIETNFDAPQEAPAMDLGEEIEIDVGDDKFVDIGNMGLEDEEEEEEETDDDADMVTRGLEDDENDETGRNVAISTFKQIQNSIVDDFENLANDEDREIYHDYLKTNILLWRDKFESSLSSKLPEPTTPEYEKEKSGNEGDDLLEILDI
jgi:hypothetical protein|tara:strand:- start:11 stop:784 length:774 start_codon:yes stop_codon:yes gene_type:complete